MKIDSSVVGMESARSYQSVRNTSRRFGIVEYQAALTNGNIFADIDNGNQETLKESKDSEDSGLTESGRTETEWQNRFGVSAAKMNLRSPEETAITNIRQLTLRYIFQLLFSGRRRFGGFGDENSFDGSEVTEKKTQDDERIGQLFSDTQPSLWEQNSLRKIDLTNIRPVKFQMVVLSADYYEREQEQTSFSTTGHVKTSDGREIDFNVNVGMSREFERYYGERVEMEAKLCDPLVINLDTDAAQLEDQTFYFDIDADGEMDEISGLGAGSGYLALDKNGDGVINDGNELFGTASGNGFQDLARYDEDGNGWIDENDEIWSKLKIWSKDSQGRDVLYRLADKNVGAIYLGNASTEHTLKGEDGRTKGVIRNSGVFLYENGNVGTIQHVDVAKYAKLA